jgi:hypothetical protein
MIKEWLKSNNFLTGAIIGLIIPVPAAFVFASLTRLIQITFHVLTRVRMADMFLLGLAVNLIVMRYYIRKLKLENTGKGILVVTFGLVAVFFIFLANSNIVLPF